MANRWISGNVIIVDSAMGNLGIFMSTGNITNVNISGIAFRAMNTGAICVFSGTNTTDTLFVSDILAHVGSGGLIFNPKMVIFPTPIRVDLNTELKVPTLTSGSAWIYLS